MEFKLKNETEILPCFATEYIKIKSLGIHPGSIKVLLNSRLGASSWHDELSVGHQNGQQGQGNHLDGVHLFFTTCVEQEKDC